MNLMLFLQGLIQIVLSLITGVFIFFMSFKVFSLVTRDIDELAELKSNNIAVSIVGTSFVFAIMLIVKTAISPAMDTLTFSFNVQHISVATIFYSIIRIIIFYIISAVFAFLILWLAIKLFLILTTEMDEMEEIKNNNIAISIVMGTLIISLALVLKEPLTTLLSGLVTSPVIEESGLQPQLINLTIFLQGLIELALSIIGSIMVFFLSFKVLNILTKEVDEIAQLKKNNISVALLLSSFVFSIMILVRATLIPAYEVLGFTLSSTNSTNFMIFFAVLRITLFFVLSSFISFVVIWIAMKGFMFLTKGIDEMKEIANNNIAVAIIVAILVISASMLLESGLTALLNGLIKAPDIGKGLLDISNIK
ncbi:MAG: hypothetical protein A2086_05870 [Spirochaetes bacterium GWD1_27_9]|nr:MAG: hypothetical protein A2Z98_17720 [Spirochaetes bacterium GWB1_27_13]OHD26688.1 MAG: hypothetical protein A2Y34_01760 [Spirochaetes bacterium GWC1_27_15]OHD35527.1 MAG: hypothetical protein A2086_05870 [Spirochaetes bacterium GWD1_27_9]